MAVPKSRSVLDTIGLVVFLCAVSLVLTVSSLAIPNTIHANAELIEVGYGWPFQFIQQDQSRFPLGGDGPSLPYARRLLSPWENSTRFRPLPFLTDLLFWSVVLALGKWLLHQGLLIRHK